MGLLGFAPIYLNGLLAIFFVFVLPGVVFVRFLDIPGFPQRWFVVFLSSLTVNHLLVTLIAALHLDPLQTYRTVAAALVALLVFLTVRATAGSGITVYRDRSIVLLSDVGWLLLSLAVLALTYMNVWKYGVPNIFAGSDVSVSWNAWSLLWSEGKFPTGSYGYPHFVPTVWAVTYIFTGSTEQYFAYYIYIVLIIAPIALNAMILGRMSWWQPLLPGFVFVWFIAEVREPWLRATLEQGWPDWIAAIFGFCGAVLFVANAPKGRLDSQKVVTALLSLSLVTIAAATKPISGLFVIAILIAICADAKKHLQPRQRNRLIIAAIALVSVFVAAYLMNYLHLAIRSMPSYPVAELSERLSRAAKLLNSNFSLPFRTLAFAGLALSPFVPRVRWLTLPLLAGFWLWADTASYDLRNLLGLLLISAFIPLYAVARRFMTTGVPSNERRWSVPDAAIAACVAVLCVGLTLPLAQGDTELKQRFANEQLSKGFGFEINQNIEQVLARGCTVLSADGYIFTISAFQRFRDQMNFFHFTLPLTDLLENQIHQSTGCMGILYPPSVTHPSILDRISSATKARGYTKVIEHKGMELLVSEP